MDSLSAVQIESKASEILGRVLISSRTSRRCMRGITPHISWMADGLVFISSNHRDSVYGGSPGTVYSTKSSPKASQWARLVPYILGYRINVPPLWFMAQKN